MKGRDKLFFNLLSFLLFVVLILVGYKIREVDKQIKRWEGEIRRREQHGVHDPQLKKTVDDLEIELAARLQEVFKLEPDPLDLSRTIKTRAFLKKLGLSEAAETEQKMRLSCTVLGKEPSAIIKYQGRSYVLMVGDKIGPIQDKYRVASIGTNKLTLVRQGEKPLVLITEKAPDTIAEEEARYGQFGEKLPVIEVKQIPGNF